MIVCFHQAICEQSLYKESKVGKITTSIAAIGLAAGSFNAYALGVGNITTSSALNQVLNAKIALVSSKNEDPSNLRIKLASSEVFKKAGIDRSNYLLDLNFEPILNKNGEISINVSSDSPIKEPFVNFILEVEWPKGRALREFTILLDPPVTISAIRPQEIQPATAYTTPVTTISKTTIATTLATSNTSNLAPAPVAQKKNYGPTKRRDTLWGIAKDLAANNNTVTHEQMMLALYDNNPKAFYKKNVNALKRGQILEVPAQDVITQRSAKEANAEFRKQNALWSSRTSTKVVTAKPSKSIAKTSSKPAAVSESSEKTSRSVESEAKLTLLTTETKEATDVVVEGNTDETPTSSSNPDIQANLAIEMATTLEQENQEVKSRLSDLETQVNKLERLLALKDEQLNQLQSSQNNTHSEKPAPEPKKATVKQVAAEEESQMPLYAGGAILIALLGAFLARRRKEPSTEDSPFNTTPPAIPEEKTNNDAPDQAPAVSDVSDTNENEVEPQHDTSDGASLLSEFTPSEFSSIDSNTEADPLTECDVYIAYGRFQQAEDLIQKAIDDEPDNSNYKKKLLDVYLSSGNAEGFEDTANQLVTLKETDPAAWAAIAEMGVDLVPDSPLFSTVYEEAAEELETKEETPSDSSEISIEDITIDEPEDENSQNQDAGADEFEFDFDLIEKQQAHSETSETEVQLEPTDEEEVEFSENNAETKLSLAEAYIEMEDFESARETLNEVLLSGTEDQIEKAQSLLNEI